MDRRGSKLITGNTKCMKTRILASLLAGLMACLNLPAEDLPVDYFFKDPTFRRALLSPEGTHLAVLVRHDGIMNLAVVDLATNTPRIITLEKQDISYYAWINNERLIYRMDKITDTEYRRSGGLYSVNRDGSQGRVLIPPPGGGEDREYGGLLLPQYIGPDPDSDRRILLEVWERSRHYPDVHSLDVYRGGNLRREVLNTVNARGFVQDVNDEIRFAIQTELVGKTVIHFRHPETNKWEVLVELPESNADWRPLDFSPDRDTFLVETNEGRDKTAIVRYNWKEGTSEVVYENPEFDVSADYAVMEIKRQDEAVGIYYEAEKPKAVWFCKQHAKLQQLLDQALPETFNQILNVDDNGEKLLVLSSSDRQMPTYYLLNLNGFQLTELTNIAPWMKREALPPKKPFSFTASDGVRVHGYLTLPLDYQEGQPVPLIVNPHGGPWARDTWRMQWYFDAEPKFYANRGFAVLQVNFRGSTGYGTEFFDNHYQNIERMYLDTLEAAKWAIAEGYAHPERIGISGASWGGYKTMLCMVKEPDFFKFGINLFGVVDLVEHINTYLEWDRDLAYDVWVDRFWDPKDAEGRKNLVEWSPLTHIDRIKGPVFIYHGVRDINVDIEQSRMLVSALDRLKHPYTQVFDTDEMHSIENPELRLEVFQKIDAFLRPFREQWGLLE